MPHCPQMKVGGVEARRGFLSWVRGHFVTPGHGKWSSRQVLDSLTRSSRLDTPGSLMMQ